MNYIFVIPSGTVAMASDRHDGRKSGEYRCHYFENIGSHVGNDKECTQTGQVLAAASHRLLPRAATQNLPRSPRAFVWSSRRSILRYLEDSCYIAELPDEP